MLLSDQHYTPYLLKTNVSEVDLRSVFSTVLHPTCRGVFERIIPASVTVNEFAELTRTTILGDFTCVVDKPDNVMEIQGKNFFSLRVASGVYCGTYWRRHCMVVSDNT